MSLNGSSDGFVIDYGLKIRVMELLLMGELQ